MAEPPALDRVNSATLARLAAERGLVPAVTPAPESVVRTPRGRWKRWLPWLFLPLSLFAVGSLAWTIPAMSEDGWSLADGVQLALLVTLVAGVVTQARVVFRSLPLVRSRKTRQVAPARPQPFLDAVESVSLIAHSPASLPRPARRAVARRRLSSTLERVAIIAMVALAILGFLGMLFVLGWILYSAGAGDPAAWLTAPFTALTGFGAWQVTGSARRSAFRGRPLTVLSRAFRDSIRVWGSGSVATKVALTTTATASVAGAAVAPVLIQRDTVYDLVVLDAANAVYVVDLATDIASPIDTENDAGATVIGFAAVTEPLTTADGAKLPKGSLLAVLQSASGGVQAVVGFRPGSSQPFRIARIEPAIPGARFSGGRSALYALQADGTAWRVALPSGEATVIGQLPIEPGPFTFDPDTGRILLVSGAELLVLNPQTGAVLSRSPLPFDEDTEVCGISAGPGDFLFYTVVDDPEVYTYRTRARKQGMLSLSGERPGAPCLMVVVPRP